ALADYHWSGYPKRHIPYIEAYLSFSKRRARMTNVVDPKAYWDLPETIWWICKRDEQWVTDMQDMSEEDKTALALFGIRPMTVVQPLKPPPPEIIAALQMMLAQENRGYRAGPSPG